MSETGEKGHEAEAESVENTLNQVTVVQDSTLNKLSKRPLELGGRKVPAAQACLHWQAYLDKDTVLWLILDKQDSSTNTLSEQVLLELDSLLAVVEKEKPKALVIRSGKENGFIYGAEISEFLRVKDEDGIMDRLTRAHEIVDRLINLSMPTIAVIHGQCLGGGLELALACDYRLARTDSKLGFPEVQLGIHPGLGGTARSLEIMRPSQALALMLSGKPLPAKKARSQGLVDVVCEERHFARAVQNVIAGKIIKRPPGFLAKLERSALGRKFVAMQAKKQTSQKVRQGHYPAPFRIIELWEQHGSDSVSMLAAETSSFFGLLIGDTAQNLIRVFFLRENLRKQGKEAGENHKIKHVHVIGAGTMGGDIAAWCAWQGMHVSLEDMKVDVIKSAMKRAAKLYKYKAHGSKKYQQAWDRLIPDQTGQGRSNADLIIEAIPERIELKQGLYKELEPKMKAGALLASNTSSLNLDELAAPLTNPQRFIGIHFFNPVDRMQLVELVRHAKLADETLNRALGFTVAIDRLPVAVGNSPGFLVNRVLTPYLMEALTLLDEGVKAEKIDAAAEQFGMPMGPIELADQVGLDICLHVAETLQKGLDDSKLVVPDWLREKVDEGKLGKKSGEGLYKYENGKPQKTEYNEEVDAEFQDRLILPLIKACITCLREGVVDNADELDAAVIFATGFAPFRGGPIHYAKMRGIDDDVDTVAKLMEKKSRDLAPDTQRESAHTSQGK